MSGRASNAPSHALLVRGPGPEGALGTDDFRLPLTCAPAGGNSRGRPARAGAQPPLAGQHSRWDACRARKSLQAGATRVTVLPMAPTDTAGEIVAALEALRSDAELTKVRKRRTAMSAPLTFVAGRSDSETRHGIRDRRPPGQRSRTGGAPGIRTPCTGSPGRLQSPYREPRFAWPQKSWAPPSACAAESRR